MSRASDRTDVLIIGAGPSGAVAAVHLAEAGYDVVCLEQGPWVNASEYPGDKPEFELLQGGRWHHNGNVRGLPEDYPCEVSEADIDPVMFNGVGGGTLHFGGQWARMLPNDFRVKTLDGVGDDWPFGYEDLLPFYEQTDEDFSVAGLGGDPAYPPSAPPPLPPHPINEHGRHLAHGFNRLGWHWWPAPNSIASVDHRNLKQCVRLGTCENGCPNGSKASVDLTHWPLAMARGARVVTRARAREVTTNDRGLATGAIYIDADGHEHHQRADIVIMAANGVGTARLLLLSASPRFPDGLANSSGLVGKRLMMHPTPVVIGRFEDPLQSWLGPAGQAIHSFEFYETDESRGFLRGARWCSMPLGGPVASLMTAGAAGAPVWGPSVHASTQAWLGHSIVLAALVEDLPQEANAVTLDAELSDSDGVPAPRIHYRVDDNSRQASAFHLQRMREALEAAGAQETVEDPMMADQPGHLLGTARMGDDPATSVVDHWGRSHDVPNLFVIDGSVFVTCGGVNPTSTIAAVALRCATGIVKQAAAQAVPA